MLTRWYPLLRRVVPPGVRHLARYPTSVFKSLWWTLKYQVAGATTIEMRPGWTVRVHPATAGAMRSHVREAVFARELDQFAAACTPGMTLVDVGSHYGVFTLAALHFGGPEARVIAIDPSPRAQRYLAINLDLNGASHRVERREQALSDPARRIRVLTTGAGQAHMMVRPAEDRKDAREVSALTLDDVAAASGRKITHVKIDVEGFEGQILVGGETLLREQRPVVALELHNRLLRQLGDDPRKVVALLETAGYHAEGAEGQPTSWTDATTPSIARLICRPAV